MLKNFKAGKLEDGDLNTLKSVAAELAKQFAN
jgi:hypothetical protein